MKPFLSRQLFPASYRLRVNSILLAMRWGASGMLWATLAVAAEMVNSPMTSSADEQAWVVGLVNEYCADCHRGHQPAGGFTIDDLTAKTIVQQSDAWEAIARKLRTRQMPPPDADRPSPADYHRAVQGIEGILDERYANAPTVPRGDPIRRMTRDEYRRAIRDLLALDIAVETFLPADESSHGFDNITVGELPPSLLQRYVLAAEKISRLAIGRVAEGSWSDTIRLRPDLTQEEHREGLPFGTRGGASFTYYFPSSGEYAFEVRLARDRNEQVEGLQRSHDMEILLDREVRATFTVVPPKGAGHEKVDAHLRGRFMVEAGPHELGITFLKQPSLLLETKRQPYQARYNMHRHPRTTPAIYQINITGPFGSIGSKDSRSRRQIFSVYPSAVEDRDRCAHKIISDLVRRAYRRPSTAEDVRIPWEFYRRTLEETQDFDAAIESALTSLLVSPNFLFRIESPDHGAGSSRPAALADFELASRLSFFLWSSLPDEPLLMAAEQGQLGVPATLEQQVKRMLRDVRSRSLTETFAGQWLYLRNLEGLTPDLRLFPDFDDNLRQAFRRETELCFDSVLRQDLSILDLLRTDHSYLNERLAKHYGIPHVYGDHFRRVSLEPSHHRGGLLRHGSILTVTSYATRTSPVIRGHWILKNLLGMAPPPPPADVPALKEKTISANLSVRQRLEEHRANDACASCHRLMDPLGLAMENYDAIGRWRDFEEGQPLDASGKLPDGEPVDGIGDVEDYILSRPDLFATTFTEKLMTFALGRGVELADAPAVRRIVRDAEADRYRLSSIIAGIALSQPFRQPASAEASPAP
jgi:hypothetical protein